MEPETIDAFIVKLRASVDTLVDSLVEDLRSIQELLIYEKPDEALKKVGAMLRSIDDVEEAE